MEAFLNVFFMSLFGNFCVRMRLCFVSQCVYTYIHNDETVGQFKITAETTNMTTSQKSLFYTVCAVVAIWVIGNATVLIVSRKISAQLFTSVSALKRLLWLSVVIIILAMHCTKKVNGNGLIVHFHHALVGWALFSLAVLFGTIKGAVGASNQILATIALAVMIHGSVLYDIEDYQLFTEAQGSGPSKSTRNLYVLLFLACIILLSIRMPYAAPKSQLKRLGKRSNPVSEKSTLLHTKIRF